MLGSVFPVSVTPTVKPIVPAYVVAVLPYGSWAVTVTLPATPAVAELGKPLTVNVLAAAAEKTMPPLVTAESVVPPDAVAVKVIMSAFE